MIKTEYRRLFLCIKNNQKALAVITFSLLVLIQERNPVKLFPDLGFQWNGFFYYGVCCFLFLTLVLRTPLKESYIGLGDVKFWFPITIGFIVVAMICAAVSAQMQSFQDYYIDEHFHLIDYLVTMTLFMIGWEYFFRGFMLAGLKDSIGEAAILIQIIPFVLTHLNKPLLEIFMCIPAGLFWGYICYRSNSFWPAVIMHLTMNFCLKIMTQGAIL